MVDFSFKLVQVLMGISTHQSTSRLVALGSKKQDDVQSSPEVDEERKQEEEAEQEDGNAVEPSEIDNVPECVSNLRCEVCNWVQHLEGEVCPHPHDTFSSSFLQLLHPVHVELFKAIQEAKSQTSEVS